MNNATNEIEQHKPACLKDLFDSLSLLSFFGLLDLDLLSSDFSESALFADSSNFLEDAEEFERLSAGLAEPADLLLL